MNSQTESLCSLPFWEYLTEAEKALVRNNAYIRFFDKNQHILYANADEDFGLMALQEGKIRAFLLSPDGREITLFSFSSPNICVFSALSLFKQITFRVFLSADSRCKVLVVNMTVLNQLLENNIYFRNFAYEVIARRFSQTMDSVQRIMFDGLEQRLAVFLTAEYDHCKSKRIYQTHDYISRYIGTSREQVTKTLKRMSDNNLIRKTRGCIEITDVKGLRELASFSEFS